MGCCTSSTVGSNGHYHNLLMAQLRDLRHTLRLGAVNRESDFRPNFENWSGNIVTRNTISFPKTDAEITTEIHTAKAGGLTITMVGAGHSFSPAVCDSDEVASVLSLASYSMAADATTPVPDLSVDPTAATATVNAGWMLDRFMAELGKDWPDFLCEAQTAGRIFTVGGLVSMCTHGGCMKAGLIADTVVGLRIIKAEGEPKMITDETELRYCRMSLGAFGIITHVTLTLRRITELEVKSSEDDMKMTEEFFANYFKDKIGKDGPLFQQFFFDFHQMKIYYGAWSETGVQRSQKNYQKVIDERAGSRGVGGAPVLPFLDEILDAVDFNYRSTDFALKGMVKVSCEASKLAWDLNFKGENDAFWVSSLPGAIPAAHYMAVMVPVDDTVNVFKAVKVAYDRFLVAEKEHKEGMCTYRPDCALEARFVWSSDSYFAPNYSDKRHSQLYIAIEQPTLSSNLYVNYDEMVKHGDADGEILALNREFSKYFFDLEKAWMATDRRTRPHLAKAFGFAPSAKDPDFYEPYNHQSVKHILSPDRKAKIRTKLHECDPTGVFKNKLVSAFLEE